MDKTRIEAIQGLADRLAEYTNAEEKRFFTQIHEARKPYQLRLLLIKADMAWVKAGKPPLVTLRDLLEVFEEGEEIPRADWSLARDLVLIRMIERLHEVGFFQKHAEIAQQALESIEAEEENIAQVS